MSPSTVPRVANSGVMLRHPASWLWVWALLLVLVRLWSSAALELDEAEQMLWSQQWAWGYGAQPSLYTWLLMGVAALLGPGLLSLSVLKMGLLALTYYFMWRAAREVLAKRAAWWAAASMVWLPMLGWEALRDLTHTVLLGCMVAATWWLVLRQIRQPQPQGFVWLGLVAGLGLLSKYSFALFALALGLAALSGRETRRSMLASGWWWLPLVAAVVLAPHLLWLLEHWDMASRGTLSKLQLDSPSVSKGFASLLVDGALANLLLWCVIALVVFGRAWWRPKPLDEIAAADDAPPPWLKPLLWRYLAWVFLLLAGMVLVGNVTHFKARWVHPLLLVFPLLAFASVPALERHPRGRWFTGAVVLGFLMFGTLFAARPSLNGRLVRPNEINEPIAALSQRLQAAGYDGLSPIVASDAVLGGMLRAQFPGASVTVCPPGPTFDASACMAKARLPISLTPVPGSGHRLLVARQVEPEIAWWQASGPLQSGVAVQTLELPYLHFPASAPQMRYQFLWQQRPLQP
jgi:4-amino-4-deoxy-L-arabinose transferase-like glycosyltransferase